MNRLFPILRETFSNGGTRISSMRVMSFEVVQVALAIAVISVYRGPISTETIGLVLGLLTVAFTGKVMQKGKEGDPVELESPERRTP